MIIETPKYLKLNKLIYIICKNYIKINNTNNKIHNKTATTLTKIQVNIKLNEIQNINKKYSISIILY